MKRTIQDLLDWGASFHYPQLALSETERVRHGELAWKRMVRDRARREKAWSRIERWNERANEERTA